MLNICSCSKISFIIWKFSFHRREALKRMMRLIENHSSKSYFLGKNGVRTDNVHITQNFRYARATINKRNSNCSNRTELIYVLIAFILPLIQANKKKWIFRPSNRKFVQCETHSSSQSFYCNSIIQIDCSDRRLFIYISVWLRFSFSDLFWLSVYVRFNVRSSTQIVRRLQMRQIQIVNFIR